MGVPGLCQCFVLHQALRTGPLQNPGPCWLAGPSCWWRRGLEAPEQRRRYSQPCELPSVLRNSVWC